MSDEIIQVNPLVFGGEGESVHANMLTKLWENPNPNVAFAAQNIELSSDDFDFTFWVANYAGNVYSNIIIPKGKGGMFFIAGTTGGAYTTTVQRDVVMVSDTEYSIGGAMVQNSNAARTTNNVYFVPIAVYGFKKSLDITAIVSNVSTDASKCMLSDGVTDVEKAIKIEMISGTMAALNNPANTSYPSGYDINNTIVLRAEVKNGSAWSDMQNGTIGLQVALFSTYISVYTRHADFAGLEYRVYLAKYRT